jgi:PAS domain S-box-containing protein
MGIIVADASSKIILANEYAQKQLGYSAKEIIGKKVETMIPDRFRKDHAGQWGKFIQHPHDRPVGVGKNLFALRKDGTEFPVEISLGHYSNNGSSYIIAFISDITFRRENENEIKRLNEMLEDQVEKRTHQLREAMQRLESSKDELIHSLKKEKDLGELKSRFVTMASHEFRTPLSTVLSSAYLLEKYALSEDQPKRKRHIDRIISSVNMLTDILNDFLSVGKIEEGKIVVKTSLFNLKDHIHAIVNEMQGIIKKGQKISHHHQGEEMAALDPALMKHIIMNLLSNAIKFSSENSPIEIKSRTKKDTVLLSVKDKGIGIPKEDLKHLFDRFHRGANVTNIQGTGLGLHIVAKYTELMNGKIECKSELEKGTEFILIFKTKRME